MTTAQDTLLCCDITVEEDAVEILWGLLALYISFGWEEESLNTGQTRFRFYCESESFVRDFTQAVQASVPMANIETTRVPQEDWTRAWREYFTPIACGKHFMVLPPWLEQSTPLEGRKGIIIEPKSAFGTGHHSTTALCLKALSELWDAGRIKEDMEFLDLGTGSGILAIGLCQLGLYGVGTDIDPLAVENAFENKELNSIVSYDKTQKKGLELLLGSVEVLSGRTFDVVIANILARPLKELAKEIVALRKDGACLILSGLLIVQAQDVQDSYTEQGLPAPRMLTDGEWAALVWE